MRDAAPILLPANQPAARPYRGGAGISRFRGTPDGDGWTPEDFIASTTEVFAGGGVGLTVLPDGRTLRAAIEADPVGYLGEEHVAAHGTDTRLLVKLLDTRQRLFVHFHPGTPFARDLLGAASGKTEAWMVLAAEPGAVAHLGFARPVEVDEPAAWFEHQDVAGMLAAMNPVALRAGDTLFVPATVPHAIGSGVTLLELQQPVDLSLLLEHRGVPGLDERSALLGVDRDRALAELDRSAWTGDRLEGLLRSRHGDGDSDGEDGDSDDEAVVHAFPAEADAFFRADIHRVRGEEHRLEAGYGVVVVLDGAGELRWRGGAMPVAAGNTLLVPHSAGATVLAGSMTAVRCRPPAS